jgi:hypothetical protein
MALDGKRTIIGRDPFYKQMAVILGDREEQRLAQEIRKTVMEFVDDDVIFFDELFNRYEQEVQKLLQQARLFIQIRKRMDRWNVDFVEVLKRYGSQPLLNKISALDFMSMVERLGVIKCHKKEDTEHLFEEYGHLEENKDNAVLFKD